MREIKFRGRAAQGEWLYGDLEYRRATGVAIIHTYNEDGTYNRQEEVNPDTVGQFTCLHDSNGKEIYEGDILVRKAICGWGTHEGEPLEVEFMNGAFGFRLYRGETYEEFEWICEEHYWSDMGASGKTEYEYEVIGNVHDNPELLKGGEK